MTMIAVEPGGRFTEVAPAHAETPPHVPEPPSSGVGAELTLGSILDIAARLDVTLGRLGDHLDRQTRDRRRPRIPPEAVTPIHIPATPIPLIAGAGTLDVPQLFRPTLGRWWDIRQITASGFTAGTVQALINNMPGDIAFPWPAAGQGTFGKGENLIRPNGERLVFVATGITGIVLISLRGAAVLEEYLADYLQ